MYETRDSERGMLLRVAAVLALAARVQCNGEYKEGDEVVLYANKVPAAAAPCRLSPAGQSTRLTCVHSLSAPPGGPFRQPE